MIDPSQLTEDQIIECSLSITWIELFYNLILFIPVCMVLYLVSLSAFQCIHDGKFDIKNQKRLFQYQKRLFQYLFCPHK
jgi:hypothetical protein